jgi:Mn2+/Fe2+ NRAMP family transporter
VSTGQGIIIGGLVFQVVSLTIFFGLFLGVVWPTDLFRRGSAGRLDRDDKRLKTFIILISAAIILIIGRSVYRVVEFSQGVFGPLGHNEVLFIILDGFPMAIATSIMVVFHPLRMLPTTPRAMKSLSQELRFLPEDERY